MQEKKLDFELDTDTDTASAKLPVVSNDQSDSQSEKDLTANPIPLIGEVYTCLKCDKSFSSNLFLNGHMIRKHDPTFTLATQVASGLTFNIKSNFSAMKTY